MRVAIDVRACLGPGAGINVYTAELIKALAALGVDVVMWFSARDIEAAGQRLVPDLRALQPGVPLLTTRLSNQVLYSHPAMALWARWPRWLHPPRLLPDGIDVYHATYWPLPLDRRIPMVLTIHDLLTLREPSWGTAKMRTEQHTILALARRAAHILCDSDATRQDVLARTAIAPERVSTVYLGVAPEMFAEVAPEQVAAVRRRHGVERPYIVSLSTRDPRKNLGRLIDAYDMLCEDVGPEWDLVLIGAGGWGKDDVAPRMARPRQGRVIVTGHIPREDIAPMLAGAGAMGYVSLAEGFGLPPLEAMACGCPVVTSNVSSLPEVVGDAALTVDPLDTEAIGDALQRVLTDRALADNLRARGRERARQFTWEKTARATLAVYEKVASGG